MDFILKTEIEAKNRYFCPSCYKTQIKRLDKSELYAKYSCWNKECENKGVPFITINEKIIKEDFFNHYCETCQEPYIREFKQDKKNSYLVI